MKLIRLTKTAANVTQYQGDKLIFNTNFKDDLTVNSNAKIAFQSIFFDEFSQDLIIDATNDTIIVSIEGVDYQVILDRDTYTPTTYDVFFNDFTNKLNKVTPFNQDTYGREWQVEETPNNRLSIAFKYGSIGTSNLELTNVKNVSGVFSADDPVVGNDTYLFNRQAMAKAAGALRCEIQTLGRVILGSRLNPLNSNSGDVPTNQLYVAVGVDNSNNYVYYKNGVLTTTAVSALVGDIMECRIDAGKNKIVYYRGGVENLLFEDDYNNESFYPLCLFQDNTGEIKNFSFSANPYLDDSQKITEINNLNIPEPKPDPTITVNITFQNSTFAEIMGFNSETITQTAQQINFKSPDKFDGLTYNNLYAVKLNNVPLESYDAEINGKSQLLYTINKQSTGEDFNFTVPYLTFLEMKNDKPLSLRNIRCEIVNSNDDIIEFFGKAVMSLVIDDENI